MSALTYRLFQRCDQSFHPVCVVLIMYKCFTSQQGQRARHCTGEFRKSESLPLTERVCIGFPARYSGYMYTVHVQLQTMPATSTVFHEMSWTTFEYGACTVKSEQCSQITEARILFQHNSDMSTDYTNQIFNR